MIVAQKRCSKCGAVKPLEAFWKATANRDGLQGTCQDCKKKYTKAWIKANPEKKRNSHRQWCAANSEQLRENARRRYAEDPAKKKKYASAWSKANPEKKREQGRRWYAAHPEKVLNGRRIWNEKKYSNLAVMFGSTCLDCGRDYPMQIFEYHHLDPATKKGPLLIPGWAWGRVKAYVKSGVVQLCPTCHRLRHFLGREKMRRTSEAAKCS